MTDESPPRHDGRCGEHYVRRRADLFVSQFPWADQRSLEITNALNACYNAQRAAIGQVYAVLGFPKALGKSSLLHALYLAGRPLKHNELGSELEITQGTVTFLVNGLEKEGLVTRTTDPTDRRTVYVELTPKGESICEKITPAVAETASDICANLSTDDKDLLLELLLRLLKTAQDKYVFTEQEQTESKATVAAKQH